MYSRVRVGKNLSEMFPIRNVLKQGEALSPLIFNFALEYAIKRVQVNQDGLKLNGTHQLLAYDDDVKILGDTRHITPIHKFLSTLPQLSISQKALGTLPEDDNVMPKHVVATIHN
jgi:hypothetical protein